MKLSELRNIAQSQKERLEAADLGLERDTLATLPDIQTHALIVSGIRRCGKSTLLSQWARKLSRPYFYFTFEDLRLAEFSVQDFQLLDAVIKESSCKVLFFDEVQEAPQWELFVRQMLDSGFQVLLTGSNASLLSRELGSKLTGRHISKELFPFSYKEFLRWTGDAACAESLDKYLQSGGFPEYLKTGNMEILSQLQTDILYRDIAVRYGLRDASSLKRLFTYLVSNAAQLVSPSKLVHVAGVKSPSTVLEYFSYFESAYLLRPVPCFSWSVKAQSLAAKKLYIGDAGIIRTGSVSRMANLGPLLENFVFTNLRLRTKDIFYWTDNASECDFIVNPYVANPQTPASASGISNASETSCIQVCRELNADNEEREIRGLCAAMDFFGAREGSIITRDARDIILTNGKKITVMPAWEWGGQ
jgi:predicted AAA+ superfamily ATPase